MSILLHILSWINTQTVELSFHNDFFFDSFSTISKGVNDDSATTTESLFENFDSKSSIDIVQFVV